MATKVHASGSKKHLTGSYKLAKGIYLTVFAFCLFSFTSYSVIKLLVARTKLKSSAITNDMAWMEVALGNWNLTSSACFYLRKRRVISTGPICMARQVLDGWMAAARRLVLLE